MSALIEKTSEIIVCDNLVEISINRDQCEFKSRQLKKKKKKKTRRPVQYETRHIALLI